VRTVHEGWDPAADPRKLPVSELVKRLSNEATSLIRMEVELAKAELAETAKVAGMGAGMLGGAAVAALCALGALTACIILALAEVMPAAVAALIVTLIWAAIGGVLALAGRARLRSAAPVAPQEAAAGLKEDVRAAREGLRAGRAGEITTTGGVR
jgi:uncharacterized membrane protein YqjE